LLLEGEDGVLPVLYRGAVHDVQVGNHVRVTGVFSEEGSGINADEIVRLDRRSLLTADIPLLAIVYGGGAAMVLVLFIVSFLSLVRGLRARSSLK